MSLAPFAGSMLPRTPAQLERDVEDALSTADSVWEREHNADGTHAAMDSLEVSGPIAEPTFRVEDGAIHIDGRLRVTDNTDGFVGLTLSASEHDLARGDGSAIRATVVKLDLSSDSELTGVKVEAPSLYWELMWWINGSTHGLFLRHNDARSTASFRLSTPSENDVFIPSGAAFSMLYDAGSEVWRVMTSEGSGVRSIQTGTISFTNGGTDAPTATITSVDTSKAVVFYNGHNTNVLGVAASVQLTNATTITGRRDNGATSNGAVMTLYFTVVEYL
jgi:hypothetical protein